MREHFSVKKKNRVFLRYEILRFAQNDSTLSFRGRMTRNLRGIEILRFAQNDNLI